MLSGSAGSVRLARRLAQTKACNLEPGELTGGQSARGSHSSAGGRSAADRRGAAAPAALVAGALGGKYR